MNTIFQLHRHSGSPSAFRREGLERTALRLPTTSSASNLDRPEVVNGGENLFPAHSGSPGAYRHASLASKAPFPA